MGHVGRTASWRLVLPVILVGVAAGLVGSALLVVLEWVQWLAWGRSGVDIVTAVTSAPRWRRLVAPSVGGLLAALAWWALLVRGPIISSRQATRRPDALMSPPRALVDAVAQIVLVGSGASLGREGAPRELSAALAQWLGRRLGLSPQDLAALVAAGAGAGLAAVYNVPAAGAVFAVEVVARAWTVRGLSLALPTSAVATVVAWPVVTMAPTFRLGHVEPQAASIVALGLVVAPATLVGLAMGWLTRRARGRAPGRPALLLATVPLSGLALGVCCWWLPEVAGNGRDLVQLVILGSVSSLVVLAVLASVKLAATTAHLAAGARGGLLMPALAVGGCLGALLALAIGQDVPGVVLTALVSATMVLAITQRAPVFAAVFVAELTRAQPGVVLVCLLAALVGHHLACHFTHESPGADHD